MVIQHFYLKKNVNLSHSSWEKINLLNIYKTLFLISGPEIQNILYILGTLAYLFVFYIKSIILFYQNSYSLYLSLKVKL